MNWVKTFETFVEEGIQKKGDKYEFDWFADHEDDLMHLKFKKYRGRVQTLEGTDTKYSFYYAYTIPKSDFSTDLLKAIKTLESSVAPRDLDQFISKAVMGFDNIFGSTSFNAIITPESSSVILGKVAEQLQKKSNSQLFDEAFVKAASTDIKLDMDKVNKLPEKTRKEVERAFKKATIPDKPFKIKEVFSAHRKFFQDFIIFNKESDRKLFNAVNGQKVVLIDDYKTSGTTLKEMIRQLADAGAAEVVVFVIIKIGD